MAARSGAQHRTMSILRPMRPALPLAALVLALSAAVASAQPPEKLGAAAIPDSLFTLKGTRQIWGHLGVGWAATPEPVRKRYNAGFDGALSGDRRLADRIAARARIELHIYPPTNAQFTTDLGTVETIGEQSSGYLGIAEAGIALRPWNHLWLEGGGGAGYLASGLADVQLIDPATQQRYPLAGTSGWGVLWSAGVRYEFQPAPRKRMLAETRYQSMDRPRARLGFWQIGVGYRLK
jgi:hypothetical protein